MFRPIFHLAFPVRNLEESKNFYVTTFGAKIGRVRDKWIDIFLFEAQIYNWGLLQETGFLIPEWQFMIPILESYLFFLHLRDN